MELENRQILVYGQEESWNNVSEVLKDTDHRILFSSSRVEVLSSLIEGTIDLVLMLGLRNETEPLKACKLIRSNYSLKNVPIIFVSTDTSSKSIINAFDAGVDDYLEFPVDPLELKDKLDLRLFFNQEQAANMDIYRENNKHIKLVTEEIRALKSEFINQNHIIMHAKKELKIIEVERIKALFLRIIVQELRSPVSAVIGFADMLKNDSECDPNHEIMDSVINASQKSKELMDTALLITEIDAEKSDAKVRPFKVSDLIEYAIKDHTDMIEKKNMTVFMPEDREITEVVIDPTLIKEVLRIIIHNAICHSPAAGKLTISVHESIDRIELKISDEGKGFSPEQLVNISNFLKNDTLGEPSNWPGIRCAIVKFIMDIHHAEILIENNAHGGASINLVFPINDAQREALHQTLSQLN